MTAARRVGLAALVAASFAAGSVATAASGWRVFASAGDRSPYSTFAAANARVQDPQGLAVRAVGSGGPFDVSWYLNCEGAAHAASGRLLVASVPEAARCQLNASARGDSGTVRVELLRR